MKKVLLIVLATLSFVSRAEAQAPDSLVYISIINDTAYTGNIYGSGGGVIPMFSVPGVNAITNSYTFTVFQQAFPSSAYLSTRQVYKMVCNNTFAAQQLKDAFPDIFPYYEVQGPVVLLGVGATPSGSIYPLLFPNPAKGELHIAPLAAAHITGIIAVAISDKQTPLSVSNGNLVNIQGLIDGVYCFQISFNDRAAQTQTIIIRN